MISVLKVWVETMWFGKEEEKRRKRESSEKRGEERVKKNKTRREDDKDRKEEWVCSVSEWNEEMMEQHYDLLQPVIWHQGDKMLK